MEKRLQCLKKQAKSKKQQLNALSNIQQVTQDDQTIEKNAQFSKIHKPNQKQETQPKQTNSLISKSINCFKYVYSQIFTCWKENNQLKIQESQISQIISKLRRKKTGEQSLLPVPRDPSKKKTLVIDLDQTLIYTNFNKPSRYDFKIEVELRGKIVNGYVSKRFGVQSFLFEMSKMYEIVVFSSSKRRYVDQVLSKLDPKNEWISYSFARQHCTIINQSYFIKPIKHLGRNMKTIIAVDDNRMSASLNPQNLYKIDQYRGNEKDLKLVKLGHFLKYIYDKEDITPIEFYRKQFETKEIKLKLKESQLQKTHKKRNSQHCSLIKCEQEGSSTGIMIDSENSIKM